MENNGHQEMNITHIPMSDIFADPELNCRGSIAPYNVVELAQDIEKVGLLQPLTVQPYDKMSGYKFRIVAGHRRHKALLLLKRKTVPCVIKTGLSDLETSILNLKENLQRLDLNILEEALAIKKFKLANYTMQEVASMVGKSTGWVQIRYALLNLPEQIQQAAAAGFVTQEQVKDRTI